MTIQSQLDQVLALAEKATPGKWETRIDPAFDPHEYTHVAVDGDPEGLYVYMHSLANTMAVASAVNFLREHGPAIRAAVGGEAVPAAWMLRRKRDDFVRGCYATKPTDESLEFAELDGDYYTPLYASPTATVDVGAKDLVTVWRAMVAEADNADVSLTLKHCADELAALIGKEA